MKKKCFRAVFCVLGFIMCIISGTFVTVSAAGKANLTLNCAKDGQIISGMEWSLYHLAEMDGDKPKLTETFQDYAYKISLGDNSASALSDLASTLYNYTVVDKLPPLKTGICDNNGRLTFENLDTGMYLLTPKKLKINEYTWEAQPLIITLDEEKDYELESYPKINYITLDGSEVIYTVKKIWEKDETQLSSRSVYITADLYCNETYVESIRLDKSNDWTYSWSDTTGGDWMVLEKEVPENYVVTYRKNEVQYVIVNTYQRPEGSSWLEWTEPSETTTSHRETEGLITDIETSTTADKSTADIGSETSTNETVKPLESTNQTSSSNTGTSTTRTTVTTTARTGSGNGSGNSSGSSGNSGRTPGSSGGNSSGSGSGNTATITKLPQTGQLWWPVLPLAVGGIVMIGIGMRLREKGDKE